MKALTWQGRRDVRVETVPDPTIEHPTDVIIRVTSSGLCGSDLHLYEVLGPFLEAGDVLVAVQDTGTGTDPATADRIFNPFFTTKPSGMGMGLSICRSIIDAHHGRLWVEPGEGPGATVRFVVPLQSNNGSQ